MAQSKQEMNSEIHGWELAYRKRPSGRYTPHPDAEFLDSLFRAHRVKRILDLGCGDGRHLVFFARRGFQMFGLDIAPMALRYAQEWLSREGLSAELVPGDMTTIRWPDAFFDAVICVHVINHHRIAEIRQTIGEIHRALRHQGWLFLVVRTFRPSVVTRPRGMVEPYTYVRLEGHEKEVPHHAFDLEELLQEFSQFDIVDLHKEISRFDIDPEGNGSSRNTICMLARKPCEARRPRLDGNNKVSSEHRLD